VIHGPGYAQPTPACRPSSPGTGVSSPRVSRT
jgi:hypothetical protein